MHEFATVEWNVTCVTQYGRVLPGKRMELELTPDIFAEERAGHLRVMEMFKVEVDL